TVDAPAVRRRDSNGHSATTTIATAITIQTTSSAVIAVVPFLVAGPWSGPPHRPCPPRWHRRSRRPPLPAPAPAARPSHRRPCEPGSADPGTPPPPGPDRSAPAGPP